MSGLGTAGRSAAWAGRIVFCVLVSGVALTAAVAQDAYPSRAVKLVVPLAAGGPVDTLARFAAQHLSERWQKPVIVENLAGASGSIGANAVARAAPDGYTLLFTVDIPLTMYPAVASTLPYDPRRDFKPVGAVATSANALFVNGSLGVSSLPELLARARADRLTFSSAGVGSPAHFAGELFRSRAQLDMTHVPYKGAAPAMAALVAGEVDIMFGPIAQGLPQIRTGKLRALAVTGANSSPLLPGVKPLVEQGFPDLVISVWYAVLAPRNTPHAVLRTIGDGLHRFTDDPAVRARVQSSGVALAWQDGEAVARAIESDLERWQELARIAGIRPAN